MGVGGGVPPPRQSGQTGQTDRVNGVGVRSLTLGVPAIGSVISLRAPFGLAYALLQHDYVARFLLHVYAVSAHGYTRGTWTTPLSSDVADRDTPADAYAATAIHTMPTYLKWMLIFEEPETRTLWLGKATPREWLAPTEAPIVVRRATTRYGRISFSLQASASANSYAVKANVTLPPSLTPPAGGLVLRLRAPLAHAGRLSSVSVGGAAWARFDAAAETVIFSAAELGQSALRERGLPNVVATFGQ